MRLIFASYLELGSVSALECWLVEQGIGTRQRTTSSSRLTGGGRFNRGALFYLLRNRTYLGMIVHGTKVYPACIRRSSSRSSSTRCRASSPRTGNNVRYGGIGWRARR